MKMLPFHSNTVQPITMINWHLLNFDTLFNPEAVEVYQSNHVLKYDVGPSSVMKTPKYIFLQNTKINHTQLKKEFQVKYKNRVTKLLNTLLSGGNLIKAINSWAVPVLTYSFRIVKWSITNLDELDRLTRRLLTKFGHLHSNSSVIRLYLLEDEVEEVY
ncbi:hypothetical protein NQ318_002241 [Aromia moschata]|uniref:Uncharacterized protein n=1 Tax=Aromia moschata TaxID=1265417 RepID=A0AAV8Z5E8_9CUCU|nr:hypothetical protein NQ318_002241 [Aromia moschata]